MKRVLLDSDIIIDFLRTGKGPYRELLKRHRDEEIELCISVVTVMELFSGTSATHQEKKLSELIENLQIIVIDTIIAKRAGQIRRGKRLEIPLADYLIGITAVSRGAPLATRNKKHFHGIPDLTFYPL